MTPQVADFPEKKKKTDLGSSQMGQLALHDRSRRLAAGDLFGIPKWLGGQEDSTQALGQIFRG